MFGRKRNSYFGYLPFGAENNTYQRNYGLPIPFSRQQQYPFIYPGPHVEWNPTGYLNPQPYPQAPSQYNPYHGSIMNFGHPSYLNQYSHNIFQNPLQPSDEPNFPNYPNQFSNSYGFSQNPYPKHAFIPKQPSGIQSMINSFKAQDGSVDINKMVNTAGQMMNAVSQVSSMVKGLGGMFKV